MAKTNLPTSVAQFAAGNEDLYMGMRDYYFHFASKNESVNYGSFDDTVSLAEKEDKMNTALFAEIERLSGVAYDGSIDMRAWASNPQVKWAANQTVKALIQAVIPDVIVRSIGLYTEMSNVDWGETKTFTIEPNELFTVSTGANAQRTTFRQKQFKRDVTLEPVNHDITVYVSLYRVLCGLESLAEFVRKAIISIERDMTKDAYNALVALVEGASFPAALKKAGYTQDNLIDLCQIVSAYNGGAKPVIVGTVKGLSKILPDVSSGYRINTDSTNMSIQLIRDFFGFDCLVLPQVATGKNYGLLLNDKKIYVMSTTTDKIVKGVFEGVDLNNTNDFYANADLTSNSTFNSRWIFEAVTNACMGVITLP